MLVRVRQGEKVGPVLGIEAGQGGEDQDFLVASKGVWGCGEIVEIIMDDRRWSSHTFGARGVGLLAESRGWRRQWVVGGSVGRPLQEIWRFYSRDGVDTVEEINKDDKE